MSTGEVVKFMEYVLFPSKILFVVPNRKMLKATTKFYILSISQIFITTLLTIISCIDLFNTGNRYISTVIFPVNIISSWFVYTVAKIFLLFNAKFYKDIFTEIIKINLRLKNLNSFFPPAYDPFIIKVGDAAWLFIFLSVLLTHIFFYIVVNIQSVLRLTVLTYDFNLSLIHSMLSVLKCFVTVINIQLEFIKRTIYSRQKMTTLEECMRIYIKICNVCLKIESLFGLPIFFIHTFYFLILISNTHCVLMKISPGSDLDLRMLENRRSIGWITMCAIDVMLCAVSCQTLYSNSEDFNVALYEVLLKNESRDLCKSKKLLSCIYINRKIGISALGFFDVDYTMLQSMVSSCTTYLVILSQYDSTNQFKIFLGDLSPPTPTIVLHNTTVY